VRHTWVGWWRGTSSGNHDGNNAHGERQRWREIGEKFPLMSGAGKRGVRLLGGPKGNVGKR
jgi:hypothetical protein